MIEPVAEWQTGPASLDDFKQPHGDDILRPGVFGLILFGGMVKDVGTAEDLLTRFGVDIVIQGHQQAAIGQRIVNHLPKPLPQSLPGNLG